MTETVFDAGIPNWVILLLIAIYSFHVLLTWLGHRAESRWRDAVVKHLAVLAFNIEDLKENHNAS